MTNKIDAQEVVIDGETYIKKSAIDSTMADNYVVVRTYSAAAYAAADAAAAAYTAAYAAAAARKETLKKCADIVRKHYPNTPKLKG